MRWEVFSWAAIALLLMAAEALVPGAFLLWLGIAAAVVFLLVLVIPGMSLLTQIACFVVLSFISVAVYRKWFRGRGRPSEQPMLNLRAEQLVGSTARLATGIEHGRGRVQIADAFWDVAGPELPAGSLVRITAAEGMTLRVEAA